MCRWISEDGKSQMANGRWRIPDREWQRAEDEMMRRIGELKMKDENMMDEDFAQFHERAFLPFAVLRFAICICRAGIYKQA